MLIDCDDCAMQFTDHCEDCIVSALVRPQRCEPRLAVDEDEERALRTLAQAGLIPEIRMRPRLRSA